MPLTEVFSGIETVGTTEHSLTTDTAGPDVETSDHVIQVFLELDALAYGDEFLLQGYEKARSGDTQRCFYRATLGSDQLSPYITPAFCLLHGWDFTLDKIAGTDRSVEWSLRSFGTPAAYYEETAAIGATEYSLTQDANYSSGSPETDDKGVQAWIDFAALAAGDHFQIRLYEKTRSGGTQRKAWERNVRDGMSDPLVVVPVVGLLHGWDLTVKKLAGTDRAINWSLRTVA